MKNVLTFTSLFPPTSSSLIVPHFARHTSSIALLPYARVDSHVATEDLHTIQIFHCPIGFLWCLEVHERVAWVPASEWVDGHADAGNGETIVGEELFNV